MVIMQLSLADEALASISNLTNSSKVKHFGILLGNLGVSSSSAILLSIRCILVLRYFQNCLIDTILRARVPAEELSEVWQNEM